ncbi:MAG: MFS transporter [Pseudobdellovibrionaceae bacterium]
MALTRSEKWLLFVLALIQFGHIVDFMIMMPLGPQLMRIFQISPQQFGVLVSAYTFAAGTSGILSALFMDRYDRKNSLMFFFVGFCFGTFACAFSSNYHFLLAARLFTGAFGGVLGSLIFAIVGDVIVPQKRGMAMGIVMSAFSAASILGVPFSLYLANHFNWHAPFVFLGGLGVCLLFIIFRFVPPVRAHLDHQSGKNPFRTIFELLKDPSPQMALLFIMMLTLGQFSIIPFLSPSLVANAGLPELQLPLIYLVGGSCSLLASPTVGRLTDKYGKIKIFWASALLSILPILIITNLSSTPIPLILAVVGVFFVFSSGRMIPAMAMVTSSVTLVRRGSFMSLVSSSQQFAAAAGSLIAGQIVTRGSSGELLNYPLVGVFAVVTSLVGLFLATRLKMVE